MFKEVLSEKVYGNLERGQFTKNIILATVPTMILTEKLVNTVPENKK